jgi:hypothetical protein
MAAKRPKGRPDPHDFSVGLEEWEDAIVANAVYFTVVRFAPYGGYSKLTVPSSTRSKLPYRQPMTPPASWFTP